MTEHVHTVTYITENTFWVFTGKQYCRIPREGREHFPVGNDLEYGDWHEYEELWEIEEGPDKGRLRVLPAGRPPGSFGLLSSLIIAKLTKTEDESGKTDVIQFQ